MNCVVSPAHNKNIPYKVPIPVEGYNVHKCTQTYCIRRLATEKSRSMPDELNPLVNVVYGQSFNSRFDGIAN
jgi:hypothetical protein